MIVSRSDHGLAAAKPAHTDGRRRRSQDSRQRIVRAMLELVQAGDPSPPAEEVAARAAVGLRTVFRHFADMDSLYREMSAVVEVELQKVIERPFQAADPRGRVIELVGRRAAVYEKIGALKLASDVHRHRSPFLASDHARMVATARAILRQHMPPELARDRLRFEAIDLLLSFEAWNRLRRDQGLGVNRAQQTLEAMVSGLLA